MKPAIVLAAVLGLATNVYGWGELGHRTVAYIAFDQVRESTRQYLDSILALKQDQDVSDIAIWADAVRRDKPYSAPWHYIGTDQQDNPPISCSLSYPKDCDSDYGCIVSALVNHTNIFVNTAPDHVALRREALYFITHFFGDIHQPLHAENMLHGGNDLPVCFRGNCSHVNLHSVWDDSIPRAMLDIKTDPNTGEPPAGKEKLVARQWAKDLWKQRGPGNPFERGCVDVKQTEFCAAGYATESNGLVCSYVMANGIDWLTSHDLGEEYYDGAIPIVEGQIFRAGIRLADWLDALVVASKEANAQRSISGSLEL